MQVTGQLLCDAARAGEEGAPGLRLKQDLVDGLAVAVDVVSVLNGHAGVVQQPQELLAHYGYPAGATPTFRCHAGMLCLHIQCVLFQQASL